MVRWLYEKEPLKIIQNPTKFGGHCHSGSGEIKALNCHVILQYHVIMGYVTLWVGAPHAKSQYMTLGVGVHQGKLPSCQA